MKVAIGLPIQETIPGEAFPHHVSTILEASNLIGKDNLVLITPLDAFPHDHARYKIAEAALGKGCDRLFFIDDDTITPRGGFRELMEVMDSHEKKPVAVSGFYIRRGHPYTPVWHCQNDGNWYQVDADSGIHEIHMSGLGSCLLDLKWMDEKLPRPWFRMKQNENHTEVTDDTVLFEGIRKAGGVILGDAFVQCAHIGRREFVTRETAVSLREVSTILEKHHKAAIAADKAKLGSLLEATK